MTVKAKPVIQPTFLLGAFIAAELDGSEEDTIGLILGLLLRLEDGSIGADELVGLGLDKDGSIGGDELGAAVGELLGWTGLLVGNSMGASVLSPFVASSPSSSHSHWLPTALGRLRQSDELVMSSQEGP